MEYAELLNKGCTDKSHFFDFLEAKEIRPEHILCTVL